jgi:hypothetical protein
MIEARNSYHRNHHQKSLYTTIAYKGFPSVIVISVKLPGRGTGGLSLVQPCQTGLVEASA